MLAVAGAASWSAEVRGVARPARSLVVIAFCGLALVGFMRFEQRVTRRGGQPLFDLDVLRNAGVAVFRLY